MGPFPVPAQTTGLGDGMEPLDVVDEGEELEVGDRIERSRV